MSGGLQWRVADKEDDEDDNANKKESDVVEKKGSKSGQKKKKKSDKEKEPKLRNKPSKAPTSKEKPSSAKKSDKGEEPRSKSAQEPSPMLEKSQKSSSKASKKSQKSAKRSWKEKKSKNSKVSANARQARSRPSCVPFGPRRGPSKQSKVSAKARHMVTARMRASASAKVGPRQMRTAVGAQKSYMGAPGGQPVDTSKYNDVDVDIITLNKLISKQSKAAVSGKEPGQKKSEVRSLQSQSATANSWPDLNLEALTENKMLSKKSDIKANPADKKKKDPIRTRAFPKAPKMDYHAFLLAHFMEPGPGPKNLSYSPQQFYRVLGDCAEILKEEPALVDVEPPVHIVGDIHGQYNDLIAIMSILGTPPQQKYLFLGDYVDRGKMSIEVMMLLFAYKVMYPNSIFLLRGNHECARINNRYGFLKELELKQGAKDHAHLWALCQKVFDLLPVCALVGTRILCMHGGISPGLTDFDKMRKIKKPIRNPSRGVVNDLLWADPETGITGWKKSGRGSGFLFGGAALNDFCERMNVDLVVRAHQVCLDGFYITPDHRLVTLFSAPMYCGLLRNAGATMFVSKDLGVSIKTFIPESNGIGHRVMTYNKIWDNDVDTIPEPILK